jgi:hypothetical protein
MISKEERQHLVVIQKWSEGSRAALREIRKKRSSVNASSEAVFDNVDWLLALIKREYHTAGVKALRNAVASYEEVKK